MKTVSVPRGWRWYTRLKLRRAGWRPGRDVWTQLKLPNDIPVFPAKAMAVCSVLLQVVALR